MNTTEVNFTDLPFYKTLGQRKMVTGSIPICIGEESLYEIRQNPKDDDHADDDQSFICFLFIRGMNGFFMIGKNCFFDRFVSQINGWDSDQKVYQHTCSFEPVQQSQYHQQAV
jgi:hypothetical protein